MIIDIVVLATLGLMTFFGYRKGFARQIIGLGAIVAVYFLAPPVATLIRYLFFSQRGITFPGQEMASLAIAGVGIFIGVWLIGRIFIGTITTFSERIEDIDMTVGGILGFLKGFLIVYLVLCGLVYAEKPLSGLMGGQLENSFSIAGARYFNVITYFRYPQLDEMREAMLVAKEDEGNQALVRLLENEDFVSVLGDEALMKAAEERDYSTLLSDERVLRLLADEDFRTVLQETEWDEVLE